jgi:hypothetical protein
LVLIVLKANRHYLKILRLNPESLPPYEPGEKTPDERARAVQRCVVGAASAQKAMRNTNNGVKNSVTPSYCR